MSIRYASGLVSTIVFDVEDQMDLDLLISIWWLATTMINEGIVVIKLVHFKMCGTFPFGVTVSKVYLLCVLIVPWDFIATLVFWGETE